MEWYQDTIELFTEDMEEFGLNINSSDVQFSGFYSQGDGASFTASASDIDLHKFLLAMLGFKEVPQHLAELKQKIDWDFDWEYDGVKLTLDEYKVLRLMGVTKVENRFFLLAEHCIYGSINRNSHRSCHENSITVELEPDWRVFSVDEYPDFEEFIGGQEINEKNVKEYYKFIDALSDCFEKFVKDACRFLYRQLEQEYEDYENFDED